MRFAASQAGVVRVLSGMNSMEQVLDNCGTFSSFHSLNEEENEIIRQVVDIINANTAIPCTACEYCTHGCPKNIAIPQYFSAYNSIMRTTGSYSSQQVYYNNIALAGHGKAGECIKCGKCEQACPQHLPIRDCLEQVAGKFEGGGFSQQEQNNGVIDMNGKSMTEGTPWKHILRFALPVLAGSLLQQLYNTVDTIIVGKFNGEDALSAVGTTTSFTFLFWRLPWAFPPETALSCRSITGRKMKSR